MITTLILAGGLGSRLGELTKTVPKPLIEICGKPISLHLVEYLQRFDISNFIFAIGYKKEEFHKYFRNLFNNSQDIIFNSEFPNGKLIRNIYENSNFRLIDTGMYNQTGSRIAQVFDLIEEDNILCTYGDGLANVDINSLIKKHYQNKGLITLTAVKTPFPKNNSGLLSRSSTASYFPVEAPEGTIALPIFPFIEITSVSIVGLPLESKT